ncbi:MAG: hypothetical protein ACJ8GW_15225 [Massilia sp.]
MRSLLLALMLMPAMEAAAGPQPPCGCAQYQSGQTPSVLPAPASPQARAIRDFILFSHRKIADDLVRHEGVYLDTLLAALTVCPDTIIKTAWLRESLATIADTQVLADRVARSADNVCVAPHAGP